MLGYGTGFQAAWGGSSVSEGDSTVVSDGGVPGADRARGPRVGPVSLLSGRRTATPCVAWTSPV